MICVFACYIETTVLFINARVFSLVLEKKCVGDILCYLKLVLNTTWRLWNSCKFLTRENCYYRKICTEAYVFISWNYELKLFTRWAKFLGHSHVKLAPTALCQIRQFSETLGAIPVKNWDRKAGWMRSDVVRWALNMSAWQHFISLSILPL